MIGQLTQQSHWIWFDLRPIMNIAIVVLRWGICCAAKVAHVPFIFRVQIPL
jgi:hypothetical protein